MSPETAKHLNGLERTLLALPGTIFHPSILISVPRSYRTAVIRAAKGLGMIEEAARNYDNRPLYRIGEKWLIKRAQAVRS